MDIVEHFGGETFAYARYGTGELLTLATNNDRNLGSGDSYEAHFNPASMLIFQRVGHPHSPGPAHPVMQTAL